MEITDPNTIMKMQTYYFKNVYSSEHKVNELSDELFSNTPKLNDIDSVTGRSL